MIKMGKELREIYKFNENEKIYEVGKEKCKAKQLSIRVMNFGQHWRTEGVIDIEYKIELPIDFVLDFLEENLKEYIEDSKIYPEPESKFEQLLRKHNWPSAKDVLENKDLYILAFDFYGHDMILQWFGDLIEDLEKGLPTFVLNSVRLKEVLSQSAILIGEAREVGLKEVLYQDI